KAVPVALETHQTHIDLARNAERGVSMTELRQLSRVGEIQIPDWAVPHGARVVPSEVENEAAGEAATWTGSGGIKSGEFTTGFAITVPLVDTTIYLDHLANRFLKADGQITENV